MSEPVIGVVTDTKQFNSTTGKEMYSINIGDNRFSGFGKSPAGISDTIEFEYKESLVGDKTYKNIILLTPYVLFMRVVSILKDILTFEFMDAFSRLMAIFWVIFHFKLIYKKREK